MSGPIASKLVFLSSLVHMKAGDKVRFLGCIEYSDASSATLILSHNYPTKSSSGAAATYVYVNADHVLESVGRAELEIGAWVNVIGHITANPAEKNDNANELMADYSRRRLGNHYRQTHRHYPARAAAAAAAAEEEEEKEKEKEAVHHVFVTAVLLWAAEGITLDAYEKALEARQRSEASMRVR